MLDLRGQVGRRRPGSEAPRGLGAEKGEARRRRRREGAASGGGGSGDGGRCLYFFCFSLSWNEKKKSLCELGNSRKHARSCPLTRVCASARAAVRTEDRSSKAAERERGEEEEEKSKKRKKCDTALAREMHSRAFQLVLLRAKEVLSASFRPRGARSGPRSGSLARKNESFFLAGWRKRGSEERRRCRKQSSEQSEKKANSQKHGQVEEQKCAGRKLT